MREVTARGIIWQIQPYQDTDALVTILSEEEGKLCVLAKGLRGIKSKRKGTIQPFSVLEFSHTIPKNQQGLPKLTKTTFQSSLKNTDPIVLAQLSLLAEVCGKFLENGHAVAGVFELWEQILRIDYKKPRQEVCAFLIRFFSLLGMFPDFRKCTESGEKFSEGRRIIWQGGNGIFQVPEDFEIISSEQKPVSFVQLKSLYFFQHARPEQFVLLSLTEQQEQELYDLVFEEIRTFRDISFKAKGVFENLIG